MIITSNLNPKIVTAKKCREKKYIKESNLVLIETSKVIYDVSKFLQIDTIFVNTNSAEKYSDLLSKYPSFEISDKICKELSSTTSPTDIFALVRLPKESSSIGDKVLILDRIQDPTNLGAIARSARAAGYNDIYLVDSVYPFTPKVIRSSMGHIFGLNIHFVGYEIISKLSALGYKNICADMDGEDVFHLGTHYSKIALYIGNEGQGVSDNIKNSCDKTVKIPMQNDVESLNASVSASILMYIL